MDGTDVRPIPTQMLRPNPIPNPKPWFVAAPIGALKSQSLAREHSDEHRLLFAAENPVHSSTDAVLIHRCTALGSLPQINCRTPPFLASLRSSRIGVGTRRNRSPRHPAHQDRTTAIPDEKPPYEKLPYGNNRRNHPPSNRLLCVCLLAESRQTKTRSLPDVQPLDDIEVAIGRDPLEVVKQTSTTANHHEQPATARVIFRVFLEVLRELRDAVRQQRDLHFGRTRIGIGPLELTN